MLPASGCLQSQGKRVATPDPPPPTTTTATAAALNQGQGLTLEGVGELFARQTLPNGLEMFPSHKSPEFMLHSEK